MHTSPGVFITIEGGEGVGKSTFVQALQSSLRSVGEGSVSERLVVTREPGGTPAADRLRQLFKHPEPGEPWSVRAEILLILAARAQHVSKRIQPELKRGSMIVCDRFLDSTWVYQAEALGELGGFADPLMQFGACGVRQDLTILLDCPVEVSMSRVGQRVSHVASSKKPSVETAQVILDPDQAVAFDPQDIDFAPREVHSKIRQGFLARAAQDPSRFCVLDATQSPEHLVTEAQRVLRQRFPQFFQTKGAQDGSA